MRQFLLVFAAVLFTGITAANEKKIYINKTPIDKKRGECVTFKASHYYQIVSGATYTWYKYAIPINSTTIKGDTMVFKDLLPGHTAQYEVAITTEGGREFTRYWLTVKDCEINEKQTPIETGACKVACEEICLKDWYYYNDKCYRYFPSPKTWEEAHSFCQAHGSKLATISNDKENNFVGNLLLSGEGAWIGLNDKSQESNYIWSYDKYPKPTYFAWDKSNAKDPEPNNYNIHCNRENCVELKWRTKKWNDAVCNAQFEFVCEVYSDEDIPGWSCRSGKCYDYIRVKMAWDEAQSECKKKNATLATIRSYSENDFIASMINNNVWIGVNDRAEAGVYVWNDIGVDQFSNKATYFRWDTGEPNDKHYDRLRPRCVGEDCVQIKKWSGLVSWSDLGCNTKIPYVCEKSRDIYLSFAAWIAISMGAGLVISIVAARGYMEMKSKRGKKEVKQMIRDATKPEST